MIDLRHNERGVEMDTKHANEMHDSAVELNIKLRRELSEKSLAFDAKDLIALSELIAESDEQVAFWQSKL